MLISPAWAHGLARADTSGGGIALLIILTAVIYRLVSWLPGPEEVAQVQANAEVRQRR